MRYAYRATGFVAACLVALLSFAAWNTPAAARGEVVAFTDDAAPGTIVVRTGERRLYLVLGQGRALRYPVGVGRAGPGSNGPATPSSTASASARPGRRRPTSRTRTRGCRKSFPADRRGIRWASPR
jgi:lipoprotein-anchoring transpeptidase ErfK/SrfK